MIIAKTSYESSSARSSMDCGRPELSLKRFELRPVDQHVFADETMQVIAEYDDFGH